MRMTSDDGGSKRFMKANWKDPKKELPERRIRVVICDSIGYMRTAYYGRQSFIDGEERECWREDHAANGYEKEIHPNSVGAWDYLPNHPWPERETLSLEPKCKEGDAIANVSETIEQFDYANTSEYVEMNWDLIRKFLRENSNNRL